MWDFIIDEAQDVDVSSAEEEEEHCNEESNLNFSDNETNYKDQESSNCRNILVNQEHRLKT